MKYSLIFHLQIASHGPASDKQSKEMSDSKRFSKESAVKEVIPKRREDDRTKLRDREKERRDKEREGRESHKDQRRDARKDTTKDQASSSDKDKDKDKENQPTSAESRSVPVIKVRSQTITLNFSHNFHEKYIKLLFVAEFITALGVQSVPV